MSKKLARPLPNEARPLGAKAPKASKTGKAKTARVPANRVSPDNLSAQSALDVAERDAALLADPFLAPAGTVNSVDEKISPADENIACNQESDSVTSSVTEAPAMTPDPEPTNKSVGDSNIMADAITFKLKGISKSGKFALYTGLRTVVRVATTTFKDPENPPAEFGQFDIERDQLAGERVKLTAEERKAARKAAPKLTAVERAAKLEERAAKLRAKAAKEAEEAAKAAEQPAA